MGNPNYLKELFNVLKNETRLQILQTMIDGRYSLSLLQQKLRKAGYRHSQGNISKEYLNPLMLIGLIAETRDEYYATTFGIHIAKLIKCLPEFANKLPSQSECHEETLLKSLLSGSKTFEEIEELISPKITSRILKRLRAVRLIKTTKDRDYVFFIKSKRDPQKEVFTATDRKLYDAINFEGISAGKLAKKTRLSIRITYKYLRHLKGKKLVFSRRTPKTYVLTCKGKKLATELQQLKQIVDDTWNSSQQVMHDNALKISVGGLSTNGFLH